MAAATPARKKAAKKTAKKKAPARKRTAKKAAKKAAPKNGAHEPIVKDIKGEAKYKLKAAELEFAAEDQRVMIAIQPELQKLINRAKRNDRRWKAAAEARRDAINEFLDKEEKKLPEGYAIINVNPGEGNYRAVHDPDSVGQRLQ